MESRTCMHCGAAFEVTEDDLAFYTEISPEFQGKKYSVPPPKMCPPCRLQHRLLFRNERKLHKRPSDLSGKPLIGMFAPDNPYKVITEEEWWSDDWDPLEYGRDIDFSRSFFDQLLELNLAVPHPALTTSNVENSDYTNFSLNARNCYLCYGQTNSEDCMYNKFVMGSRDVLDSLSLYECERCYEGIASQNCQYCMYFLNCKNCSDSLFLEECQSCRNCMLCFGLQGKQFCVLNEQLSEEEYKKRRAEIGSLTPEIIENLRCQFVEFKKSLPHRASHIVASEDCTGDMISNSRNCTECFDINNCENCKYVAFTPNGVSAYDTTFTAPLGPQWSNHCISSMGHRMIGTFLCWEVNDTYYSINCRNGNNLFGCIGLKRRDYCILNKQYSEEQYEELVPRLIEHMQVHDEWGGFLPPRLSHFCYNETIAQEYFPLSKEEVEGNGWKWREEQETPPEVEKIIPAEKLPSQIADIPDDILNWALICASSGRPYRIMKQELQFYRDMQLPIPHLHPDERHGLRLAQKNPYQLYSRVCAKCGGSMQTNIPKERMERVYCEECYLAEIY